MLCVCLYTISPSHVTYVIQLHVQTVFFFRCDNLAACAFITGDHQLRSLKELSAYTRHRTHRSKAIQTSIISAGGRGGDYVLSECIKLKFQAVSCHFGDVYHFCAFSSINVSYRTLYYSNTLFVCKFWKDNAASSDRHGCVVL